MKIILSTTNPSKAEQIKAMFNDPAIEILTLIEAGIAGEAVEDGTTLAENAWKKAIYAFAATPEKCWFMADDTGLFVDALNGEPGIYSARYAGEHATTDEITQYILKKMEGMKDRSARFETAVVLISPTGETYNFTGTCDGWIMESPQAPAQPKMPYSPLFKPNGSNKVWAQMKVEEENAMSHRGKAFAQVVAFLEKELVQ